jgi:hypothetical protein
MSAGLTVKYLAAYPQFGNALGLTSVNASSFTFTSGVSTTYTSYVAGYLDGEGRCKMYYTDGQSVALPQLVKVTQVSQVDSAGNTKVGGFYLTLGSWAAGSPDSASANSEVYLDQFGLILAAGTAYG